MTGQVRVVVALWFVMLVSYLDRVAISFAGPVIMKSLAIGPASFGIVLSAFAVGYFLTQVPGGMLADRWGTKPLLVIGPIFWALFIGATGLVYSLSALIVLRLGFGIAEGLPTPAVFKTVGDTFPSRDRAKAMAICTTAIALAPAFAGPLVGRLVVNHGWRAMFAVMAVPSLLAALVSFVCLPASSNSRRTAPSAGVSFASLFHNPSLWLLIGSQMAFDIAFWGYLGWMPTYLASAHHINLKALGPLAGIPYLFAFFGLVFGGWLGTGPLHRRRPQLIACFYLLAGLSLFLAYRAGNLPLSLAGLSGAAFFLFGNQGPKGAVLIDLAPERYRGAYVGLYTTAGQIGGIAAPVIVGLLVESTGSFAAGFGFMIGALCIGALCMMALAPRLSIVPRAEPAANIPIYE